MMNQHLPFRMQRETPESGPNSGSSQLAALRAAVPAPSSAGTGLLGDPTGNVQRGLAATMLTNE